MSPHEAANVLRDHFAILFECEMTRIEEVEFQVLEVPSVRMRAIRWEDGVVLPPDDTVF